MGWLAPTLVSQPGSPNPQASHGPEVFYICHNREQKGVVRITCFAGLHSVPWNFCSLYKHSAPVFPFVSAPLKTYLLHGDIDLTAIASQNNDEDMAKSVCDLLKREELKAADFLVEDVQYIPAQVKIVKYFVQHISVDISFNQVAGLCLCASLNSSTITLGETIFFKHNIILIKAWCYYEGRILGAQSGLISTYALEILVLHIINRFHSSVDGPLAVLYWFLDYYHTFDWGNYGISIYGPVAIKCLQGIVGEDSKVLRAAYLCRHLL